jgi:hypothetical protein
LDDKIIKVEVYQLLTEIQAAKKDATISTAESAKALKIINQALNGDKEALSKLDNLQHHMKFSFSKDSMNFLAETANVAFKKYPIFATLVTVASIAQIGLAAVSPSFLLQLAANTAIGAVAITGYELWASKNTTKTEVKEESSLKKPKESELQNKFQTAKEALKASRSKPSGSDEPIEIGNNSSPNLS